MYAAFRHPGQLRSIGPADVVGEGLVVTGVLVWFAKLDLITASTIIFGSQLKVNHNSSH